MDNKFISASAYNHDIYEWSLRMQPYKWHSIKNIKMDKQKFIDCITYLIAIGEPLLFKNDFSAVRREYTFQEEVEYGKRKCQEIRDIIRTDYRKQ